MTVLVEPSVVGLVALGGAAGAAARFLVDVAVSRRTGGRLPWGTLTVNVLGSGLLGVVVATEPGSRTLAVLAVGFCGAFTTASTFAWEVLLLARRHQSRIAAAYVLTTVAGTSLALAAGRAIGGG